MKFYNSKAVSAQAMNTNFASPAFQLLQVNCFSFQAVFTGSSITGQFYLQGSCDPMDSKPGDSTNPTVTNWSTITGTQVAVIAAGDYLWNISLVGYNYVRLAYTDSSGGTSNGVCNARFNAK